MGKCTKFFAGDEAADQRRLDLGIECCVTNINLSTSRTARMIIFGKFKRSMTSKKFHHGDVSFVEYIVIYKQNLTHFTKQIMERTLK